MEQVEKPSSLGSARSRVTPGGDGRAATQSHLDGEVSSDRAPHDLEPATPISKPRKRFQLFDTFEKPIEWLIRLAGWSSIIGVLAIFVFIFKEAAPMVPKLDWIHFFSSPRWIPNPAPGNEPSFGALALIIGTFTTTFIGLLIAVPVGLGAAVYISEFAGHKVKETLKIIIELLAAIPSIVWGFIGLMVLGPIIKDIFTAAPGSWWGKAMVALHLASAETGASQGTNLLTGGIILALMSVPLIVSLSEDALRAVPDSFREATLALGANPWETVRRVLFPAARNGLLAACMLGMGRAIGETMAVLLATGHNNRIPEVLTDPVRTITATIAAEMGETVHGDAHYQVLFILGIVLFVVTCSINVFSDLIVKGVRKANKA
jgi:phosphate transport system permease protein